MRMDRGPPEVETIVVESAAPRWPKSPSTSIWFDVLKRSHAEHGSPWPECSLRASCARIPRMSVRQQLPQRLMDPVGRHRLHQTRVESRFATSVALVGRVPTRHSDEPNVFAEHEA
jgi:hypothetical protein